MKKLLFFIGLFFLISAFIPSIVSATVVNVPSVPEYGIVTLHQYDTFTMVEYSGDNVTLIHYPSWLSVSNGIIQGMPGLTGMWNVSYMDNSTLRHFVVYVYPIVYSPQSIDGVWYVAIPVFICIVGITMLSITREGITPECFIPATCTCVSLLVWTNSLPLEAMVIVIILLSFQLLEVIRR